MAWNEASARAKIWGAALALLVTLPVAAQAATTVILHSFQNTDGAVPEAGLTPDADGRFVGVTSQGASDGSLGSGFAFRIEQSGKFKTLKEFGGADGSSPQGEVAIDASGAIYGTTRYTSTSDGGCGCGLVWKISPKGKYKVLYRFLGGADGGYPHSALLLDADGAVYGTAEGLPGTTAAVVFKVAPDGAETVLHTFTTATGDRPQGAGVAMDAKGNLYGTTSAGGAANSGVLYRLAPNGDYQVLHDFGTATGDGLTPYAGVIIDPAGDLIGTAKFGGAKGGGVVFRYSEKGVYSIIHSFDPPDGRFSTSRVVANADGVFFGTTTQGGGSCDCGVVYRLTKKGRYSVLHRFTASPDGREPYAGLALDAKGRLYGTTHFGGGTDDGVVFRVNP